MAFTAVQANTEVRALLNEATASFWSDTEIDSWIEQGTTDFCEKSLLHIKEDTITIVTNQVQYTTSTNSYIDNAIFTLHSEHNNIAMQRVTYEQIRGHNQRTTASDPAPAYYYDVFDGTTFTYYLGPKPSSTYNTQTISVLFALQTNDITELPGHLQQNVFLYAYSKAKIKERQYQESALAWQQYINNINFARRDALEREVIPTDAFRIK